MATGGDEVRVDVIGVFEQRQELPDGEERVPLLVLRDGVASRELHIPIGACEFAAIHVALQQHVAARPLTHDLGVRLLENLSASLDRVVIEDVSDEVYYARLHLTAAGGELSLPARPGDAVALALRAEVPVCVVEEVFARAAGNDGEAS